MFMYMFNFCQVVHCTRKPDKIKYLSKNCYVFFKTHPKMDPTKIVLFFHVITTVLPVINFSPCRRAP